ncbi:hypothetical protein [Saccharopolyspora rectivirgula]|uniref:hypothetical protein n=1 Tax=Saccharopolyspora rectivirgula TaxID=28042 RepID=UPI001267ECA5|nr:hypothetical protein [Saccharopolyspora rectivirgula]
MPEQPLSDLSSAHRVASDPIGERMLPDALSTQNTLHDNLLTDHQVTCSHEAAVTDRESVPAEDVPDEKWTQW